MKFEMIPRTGRMPNDGLKTGYLKIDHWNDYSFVTLFQLAVHDEDSQFHDLGHLKIGFIGQVTQIPTYERLAPQFEILPDDFFSLGGDVDYYRNVAALSASFRVEILVALNDMVFNPKFLDVASDEPVFRTSLLRTVSLSVIKGQYVRVLSGRPPLTDFEFVYRRKENNSTAGIELSFVVKAGSKPSTNIHALIGRNGVGKTTILNHMIESVMSRDEATGGFYEKSSWSDHPISRDYFSSLISISFSAFDPFDPPKEQADPSKGTCYFYIGLKKQPSGKSLKDLPALQLELLESMKICFSESGKRARWETAISALESDSNFAEMDLTELARLKGAEFEELASSCIRRLSSGHAVVLLSVSRLVARVEEKSLVLIDEPESHLHPPLLSAFIRALSGLLHDRNGVAIVATHSPVVLQEVPKSCVSMLDRSRLEMKARKPEEETFGENVGTLTREVFGLEVVNSGFHQLLRDSVATGGDFETINREYGHQLGFEAQALLRVLIVQRDRATS